jgi:hypothetical protein
VQFTTNEIASVNLKTAAVERYEFCPSSWNSAVITDPAGRRDFLRSGGNFDGFPRR